MNDSSALALKKEYVSTYRSCVLYIGVVDDAILLPLLVIAKLHRIFITSIGVRLVIHRWRDGVPHSVFFSSQGAVSFCPVRTDDYLVLQSTRTTSFFAPCRRIEYDSVRISVNAHFLLGWLSVHDVPQHDADMNALVTMDESC